MTGKRRLSASVDAAVIEAGQAAVAEGSADSLSGWVNDALHRQADHDRRLRALDDFTRRLRGRAWRDHRGAGRRRRPPYPDPGSGRPRTWRGVSPVLDAGAFLAVERGDRDVVALVKRERKAGRVPVTHGGVVAQVWRGGGRQALLARLLAGVEVVALDEELGRRTGVLLARAGTSDVVDAAVVLLARDGDNILTSDPRDLLALAEVAGAHVELVTV